MLQVSLRLVFVLVYPPKSTEEHHLVRVRVRSEMSNAVCAARTAIHGETKNIPLDIRNFDKSQPIVDILSLTELAVNVQQNIYHTPCLENIPSVCNVFVKFQDN